ncbi:hypothetical protein EDD16DRAFT_256475 [Pisolithus croceorrhizus]|nr:hypothetical protein EDD16DRAFT_256475 [Pisolithus croceorrhizus]KAI6119795.1 hypothetical protein EV401DRAFT_1478720 [Pisolithus croceorrhizus]
MFLILYLTVFVPCSATGLSSSRCPFHGGNGARVPETGVCTTGYTDAYSCAPCASRKQDRSSRGLSCSLRGIIRLTSPTTRACPAFPTNCTGMLLPKNREVKIIRQ